MSGGMTALDEEPRLMVVGTRIYGRGGEFVNTTLFSEAAAC